MALIDKIKHGLMKSAEKHRSKHEHEKKEEKHEEKGKKKHVGFKGAEEHVEKEGYSKQMAARIIGFGKAHASAAAKKANSHLNNTSHHKVAQEVE